MTETAQSPSISYQPCDSSQVSAFGYDPATQTLGVQFKAGGTYHYYGVPQAVFDAMVVTESIGKFFGQHLRGKYAYERQPDEPGGVVFGLPQKQEPKYTSSSKHGRLVNRSTGKAIPDDEPVFILRAQDKLAMAALEAYLFEIEDPVHAAVVGSRIADFAAFAQAHPERMKVPDSEPLLA